MSTSLPASNSNCSIESLDQLFTRVASRNRPSLNNLEPNIFTLSELPSPRQVIEITGDSNTGKTHLLMEFIVRCVLPARFGGCEADVFFIDTEHHFQIFKLAAMLEKHLRNTSLHSISPKDLNSDETRTIINTSLKRCHILKCHSPEQLQLAIFGLDRMFRENSSAALLALDSVSTFYWLESSTPIRMDTYAKTLIGKLANVTRHHGAALVYVKPESFKTRTEHGASSISAVRPHPIDYCIRLEADTKKNESTVEDKCESATFRCVLMTGKIEHIIRSVDFTIDSFGIQWQVSK